MKFLLKLNFKIPVIPDIFKSHSRYDATASVGHGTRTGKVLLLADRKVFKAGEEK
jgi:hypothetical protein